MRAASLLALTESDQPMLLWYIIGGLMALGPVLASYIRVYEWMKGKGIDTSNFVTREELAAMKGERDAQIAASIGEIKADFNELQSVLNDIRNELPAIHRTLGRLEGHDEVEFKRKPR